MTRHDEPAEGDAAEQRGREDNADHGMCYVSGSKALEARELAAERRGRVAALDEVGSRIHTSAQRLPEWLRSNYDDALRIIHNAATERAQ